MKPKSRRKKIVYTSSRIKAREKRDRIVAFSGFSKGRRNLMPSWKIRAGDLVLIIAGKDKGKTGKVRKVLAKLGQLVVEGVNLVTKHKKATSDQEEGQRISFEKPIDISNVQIAVEIDNKIKGTRVRRNEKKERVSVLTGKVLD